MRNTRTNAKVFPFRNKKKKKKKKNQPFLSSAVARFENLKTRRRSWETQVRIAQTQSTHQSRGTDAYWYSRVLNLRRKVIFPCLFNPTSPTISRMREKLWKRMNHFVGVMLNLKSQRDKNKTLFVEKIEFEYLSLNFTNSRLYRKIQSISSRKYDVNERMSFSFLWLTFTSYIFEKNPIFGKNSMARRVILMKYST